MRVCMVVDTYLPAVAIGDVMRAFGFAEIIESRHPDYKKGDRVTGFTGLQEYAIIDDSVKRQFQKVPKIPFVSDTVFLGVLGINGLTAFFGMEIRKPRRARRWSFLPPPAPPAASRDKSERFKAAASLALPAATKSAAGHQGPRL